MGDIGKRDNLFDNMKGLLVFLVTLGHFIQIGLRDRYPFFQWMWVVIYSFHMPTFIFISGYFAKKHLDKNGRVLHRLAIQYLLGCLFLCLIKSILNGELTVESIWYPPFGMWYLLCLFIMYLVLPWMAGVKMSIGVSVLAALFVGWTGKASYFLSLSRAICLLPFFLLGALLVSREEIYRLRRLSAARKLCLLIPWAAVFAAFLFCVYRNDMNYNIVWLAIGYHESGMRFRTGMAARGLFFLCAFCTGAVLFMTMTERKCFLSKWGRNSLSVYLFHLVVFYPLKAAMKHLMPYEDMWLAGGLLMAAAVGTVWLMSRDTVSGALHRLIAFIEKLTWKGGADLFRG